jgi:hypothetical protein
MTGTRRGATVAPGRAAETLACVHQGAQECQSPVSAGSAAVTRAGKKTDAREGVRS